VVRLRGISPARAGQQRGTDELLGVAVRQVAEGVAERDDLALLGEAYATVLHGARHGANGLARTAATTADGAAATVEQAQVHAFPAAHRTELVLCAVQRPVRHPVAAILVAVGVAEHDLLEPAPRLELQPVYGIGEEGGHAVGAVAQVVNGLEQRHEVEGGLHAPVPQPPQARLLRQEHGLEDVAHAVRHADDAAAHGVRLDGQDVADGGERLEDAARRVTDGCIRCEQRPRVAQLATEHVLLRGLAQLAVRSGDTGDGEDVVDGALVDVAVLAHVQRGQVQAEGADEDAAPLEAAVPRDTGEAGLLEAALRQVEVRQHARGLARRRLLQTVQHAVDETAVRLVAEPVLVGCDVVFQQPFVQCVRHADESLGDAQLAAQRGEFAFVQCHGGGALAVERPAGDVRGDVGVAISVGADPAAPAQERRQLHRGGVPAEVVAERPSHVTVDARRRLPDAGLHEPDALLDFIANAGPLVAYVRSGDEERDLVSERVHCVVAFGGSDIGAMHVGEEFGDAALRAEQRAATRFRGVRRERRLHVEPLQQRHHLVAAAAVLLQPDDNGLDGLGTRAGGAATGALPVDAPDLLLLRLVDEVEERAVRADQPADLGGAEGCDARGDDVVLRQVAGVHRVLAQQAQLLHESEDSAAGTLPNGVAQQRTQQVHADGQGLRDAGALGLGPLDVVVVRHVVAQGRIRAGRSGLRCAGCCAGCCAGAAGGAGGAG
jgi:hypothetical protein